MSMTREQYDNWCTAVTRTNEAVAEILSSRETNYDWMRDEIKTFFGEFTKEPVKIHFEADASEITVCVKDDFKLDAKSFATLPFNFTVKAVARELVFKLKPDVVSVDELRD